MNNSEQQINKQLNRVEEQQQINHIKWLLTKNTKKGFFHEKSKGEEISQWINHQQLYPQSRKRNFLSNVSQIKAKEQSKQKKKSKYLDSFNQTQTNSFYRYEQLPEMTKREEPNLPNHISQTNSFYRYEQLPEMTKREEPNLSNHILPNKLNLKLPIPTFLEQYSVNPQSLVSKSSLLYIRKLLIPVNFLKKSQKKTDKSVQQQKMYPFMLRGKNKGFEITSKLDNYQTYRKGKMMGSTKRSIKGLKCFDCKSLRNSLQNNKLKQCITFLKS